MPSLWETGERNAFAYLLTQLTETENQTAFLGELPANFANETYDYMWFFALMGPGEVDNVGAGQQICGYNDLVGTIEGVFLSRSDAQQFAEDVKALMPVAKGAITKVDDLRMTAEPMLERGTETERKADQDSAGNLRVWLLTIPVQAVLKNNV